MNKQRRIGLSGAAAKHNQLKSMPSPRESQLEKVFNYPTTLIWSDKTQTTTTLRNAFATEADYQRYKEYKNSGKPYPVKVEAIPPADNERDDQSPIFPEGTKSGDYNIVSKMCEDFSDALQQYLGIETLQQEQVLTETAKKSLPDLEEADL